ncbi:hypothetical protein F4860DRAFT_530152, partial [Xylaria cubensis]
VQHEATQVQRNQQEDKVATRKRKRKKSVFERLDHLMQLIQDNRQQYPALQAALEQIFGMIVDYQNQMGSESVGSSMGRLLFRRKSKSDQILLEIERTTQELSLRFDMQSIMLLDSLRKEASPPLERYSNGNLDQLVENSVGEWRPKKPNVTVSQAATLIDTSYVNAKENEIQAHICLLNNFSDACDRLAKYFSYCSRPIKDIFPEQSKKYGEIQLKPAPKSSNPVILWVYYNIYVQAELFLPERNISIPDFEASNQLYDFADSLFKHIQDGMVGSQYERTLPKILDLKAPGPTKVGKTFCIEIKVSPSGKYYDDVHYDGEFTPIELGLLYCYVRQKLVN